MKRLAALLIASLLLLLAAAPACAATYKYAYKSSGKHVGVYGKAGGAKIGHIASGTKIEVLGTSGSYTRFRYGKGSAYVRSVNVVNSLNSQKKKTSGSSSDQTEGEILEAMNAECRRMRQTDGYEVIVRPSKPSGYVNLRFGPSTATEVMDRLYMGYTLEVLAKGRAWLQVRDPQTGKVGYIYARYTSESN